MLDTFKSARAESLSNKENIEFITAISIIIESNCNS